MEKSVYHYPGGIPVVQKTEFRLDYGALRSELEKMGGEVNLTNIRQAVIRIRRSKLPDVAEIPNAGSFLKIPWSVGNRRTGFWRNIPECLSMRGRRCLLQVGCRLDDRTMWLERTYMGKAGVHDKQALVLVNRGGASGIEITRLANEIRKSVFMKFGIWIEPEVYVI